jgi:MYXO-CTERM domain-containing protein
LKHTTRVRIRGRLRPFRGMARLTPLAGAGLVLLQAHVAQAAVTQPNGVVVPTDNTGNGEMRLDAFFASKGEPIDWREDAYATPATFSPLCGFRATLERVDSGSKFGVGWYNVDPNATTAPTDVYEIIPQNATPGQQFTGDDIRSSPLYAGGLIGFALIRTGQTPPYHYSESHWNIYCHLLACLATPGHWILSLTYQSKNVPNAWYMGFEDGATSDLGWSNDGDFNDSLFFFEGLACEGAGEPCVVPDALGECAAGLTECVGSGALECRQVTQPGPERCDAVDNDCNGAIDDGEGLCADGEICHRGVCQPHCGRGEFACTHGKVCEEGVCVDPACAGTSCGAGQLCIDGACVVPCAGVVCPGAQVCRLGRCVDPCDGVACDTGRVCAGGVCVPSCDCRACEGGTACQSGAHPLVGQCVPAGCLDVVCPEGAACTEASGGTCAPLCHPGVVCPRGEVCEGGHCVEAPDGSGGSGGMDPPPTFGGGPSEPPDPGAGGQAGGSAGTGDAGPSPGLGAGPSGERPGCGCRVPGGSPPGSGAGALAALIMAVSATALRRRTKTLNQRAQFDTSSPGP